MCRERDHLSLPAALVCLGLICILGVPARAQIVGNDTCDQAVTNGFFVTDGSNPGLTNVGATVSGVTPSCTNASVGYISFAAIPLTDTWYAYQATSSCTMTFALSSSTLGIPTLAVWDGNGYLGPASCGTLPELACSRALFNASAQVQIGVAAGDFLLIQVGNSNVSGGGFTLNINPPVLLSITAPTGSGSLQISNDCGIPNSQYVTAIVLNQGTTPYGWFFGLDISFNTLLHQIYLGPPFFGTFDATGSSLFTLPTIMPSGVTLHAVTVVLDPVTGIPSTSSGVVTFVSP